jgi:hypothetical protein
MAGGYARAIIDLLFGVEEIKLRNSLPEDIRTQIHVQVTTKIEHAGVDRVKALVMSQAWEEVLSGRSFVGFSGFWSHLDAGFLSFYDTVAAFGFDFPSVDGILTIAKSAGFWWPFRKVAVLTDRPTEIALDESRRPHNTNGPAVRYSDGFEVWAFKGVRVPRDVIERPDLLTAERIRNESNAETRRVMLERFGFDRFVQEGGATVVHGDECRELLRIEINDDEPLVMMKVRNSTPEADGSHKDYLLRVPPSMERAKQAVAWTFDIPELEYVPWIET